MKSASSLRWATVSAATAARRVVADRGNTAVSLAFYVVVSSVLLSLWRAAAQAKGGTIVGYDADQLTWYAVAAEAVTISLATRMIETTGDAIASGSIAVEMLRPASVLGVRIASEVGATLAKLTACAITGVVLASVIAGAPPNPAAAALAVPALALAVVCNICGQHAFAGAAFWIRDVRSGWFLYQKLVFVLGGMLMPLEVLPDTMREITMWLPFMAMAYAPARLVAGHFEPHLLLVQCFWLGAMFVLARAVFAAGERRLQVVGG